MGVYENKTFECKVCDFTTTRKDNLKRHNEMKHGIKRIKLSHPAVETKAIPNPRATPTVEPSSEPAVEPQDEPCDKVKSAFNKKNVQENLKT